MAKALASKGFRQIALLIILVVLFYVSFQYFWIAKFPIGDDVINHVAMVQQLRSVGFATFAQESLYPLSVQLYSMEHRLLFAAFGFSLEKAFIFTVSFNLFLTSVLTGLLALKLFKNYQVAVVSALVMATSRWVVDNLRMGVMAESFGWVFFLLILLLYVHRQWIVLLVTLVLSFFIHPMPFGMAVIYLVVMTVFSMLVAERRKWWYWAAVAAVGVIGVYALYHYDPFGIFSRAISVAKSDMDAGFRTFFLYATDTEPRRYSIYFLSLIGAALMIIRKQYTTNMAVVIYLVGMCITFKDWFGIHYLSYRFYFYYELSAALLGAYGLSRVVDTVVSRRYTVATTSLLAYMLIQPQWSVNHSLTAWQALDVPSGFVTPPRDLAMLDEIQSFLPGDAFVYSNAHWARWLVIRGVHAEHGAYKGGMQEYKYADLETLKMRGFTHLYFSSNEPRTAVEDSRLLMVRLDKDNVRLYEFK